ncbi:MAG: glycosyltransferase family 9 protein, partial [candidate division Zixibacteria bacterium]|nr:glycosyltransferase family 9 protein [candidate division Zixibacteria bacterium]
MNTNKNVGSFLFNLFNLLSFNKPRFNSSDLDNVNRILVISLHKIGDVLFTTPTIRALKEKYPKAKLTVWVKSRGRAVLENNPHIDEILVFDNVSTARGFENINHFDIVGRLKFVSELRIRKFDLVVDLIGTFATNIFSFLSGAPLRFGFDNHGFGFLLTRITPVAKGKHLKQNYLDVIRTIGIIPKNDNLEIKLSCSEEKIAEKFVADHNLSCNDFLVGIHPGAGWSTKRWPPAYFGQLANLLVKEADAKVILFGNKDEEKLLKEILQEMEIQPIILFGKSDLREMAAIISKCHLFLGNDTGPTYIAEALKVPVGVFFGPTNPIYSAPQETKHVVIRKIIQCSPVDLHQYCFDEPGVACRLMKHECMKTISAAEALEALRPVLTKKG